VTVVVGQVVRSLILSARLYNTVRCEYGPWQVKSTPKNHLATRILQSRDFSRDLSPGFTLKRTPFIGDFIRKCTFRISALGIHLYYWFPNDNPQVNRDAASGEHLSARKWQQES
jgi:hypothetical protein